MKPLLLLSAILLLYQCDSNNTEDTRDINLLASPVTDIMNVSEIATDIEYIPLQTVDNALIKFIYDIKASDEKYYIYTLTEIICFDRNGKFLYKLSNEGRGPNEYNYIFDFDISPKKGLLLILVRNKISIYIETEKGFELYKSLSFKDQPSYLDLIPSQDTILISYRATSGIEPLQNMVINLSGDTLSIRPNYYLFKKTSGAMLAMKHDNIIFNNGEFLCFKGILSDTIFSVDRNINIKPYFILNSEGNQLTTEALDIPMGRLTDNTLHPMTERIIVYEIMEVTRYLIYKYSFKKTSHLELYDKILNSKYNIPIKAGLIDDINGGPKIELKFAHNKLLYSWVDALTFKKYVLSNEFRNASVKDVDRKIAIEKLANSIKETDNQILIVIKPKE